MKERAFTKKASVWKKAAACALAAVFLLSACGMAKDTSSSYDTSPTYQNSAMSGGGSYAPQAYEEAASEESYEREEAMEIADDYDTPMAAADGDEAVNVNDGGSSSDSEDGAVEQADLKSSNRKIVYTGNISLQSLEYDASVKSIHDKITQCGGFIENEDTYNNDPYWYYTERTGAAANRTRRTLSLTARIPAEKFDAFMKDLENDGQVTNTSISARNISVSYANHDASRKALEIEQKRLLEMMDKADTVEDMIAVEERLTEVERELGNEKTTLSAMDRDVDFSTVYISLEEVFEYSEKVVEVTYGERLQRAFGRAIDGFVTFWEELLLFIVETFPFLIMLAVIIALVVRFFRRRRRRKMEQRALEEEERRKAMEAGVPYMPSYTDGKRSFFRRREKNTSYPQAAVSPAAPAAGAPAAGTQTASDSGAPAAGTQTVSDSGAPAAAEKSRDNTDPDLK